MADNLYKYVGFRYVPKIMGAWDNTLDYEGLSIVTYEGTSYTSKNRVPVGIDINNTDYWVITGDFNAQLAQKANEAEVIKKGHGTLNDFDETTRAIIQGLEPGTINAVLGVGNVEPINTSFFSSGKNKLDYTKTVTGFYVNQSTGAFEVSASHRRTAKLKAEQGSYVFSYRHKTTGTNIANNVAFRHAFYDENGEFISGGLGDVALNVPTNAVEMALSWLQTNDTDYNIQLERGTEVTSFSPYAFTIPNDYINFEAVNEQIDEINSEIEYINNTVNYEPTNLIFEEEFKAQLPTHLTNGGGFTLDGGLVSPTTPGYTKQVYYNKEVCLDREKIYVDVELTNISSVVGVGFRSAISGLLCEVDFINSKLIIRNAWSDPTSATPPNVAFEKAIPFAPALNRKYLIVVEKDTRKNVSIMLTDSASLQTVKLDVVEQGSISPSNAWGGASIIAIAGSFKVKKFSFLNNQPSKPTLAIYGDSFIEGTTLVPNVEARYAAKIKAALKGDCIIGGKGGETTNGLIGKIDTYSKFRPKYTLLSVGLNDTVFSAYQTRIQTLIDWCESIGSIPILTTITRNMATDNLVFMQQVNNYVRTSGYLYVDFAVPLSVGYDGETQNTALFLADQVHPNVDGHELMYRKALADIPEVFDIA